MNKITKRSTLGKLREKFPAEGWRAERAGFGWHYANNMGDTAHWCSCLAPRYPDDDETSVSRFYIYRKKRLYGGAFLR